MKTGNVLMLVAAAALPLSFWALAPSGAEWAGTDDRVGELAQPAGRALLEGPQWTPGAERLLFFGQATAGAALLAGSLWRMKARRGRN
ncbi:MAG: hypothetical protein FJW38_25570 [Acidobacteria bacterium]|nr:hypothetical protein [Acidobacteriota bacterium]